MDSGSSPLPLAARLAARAKRSGGEPPEPSISSAAPLSGAQGARKSPKRTKKNDDDGRCAALAGVTVVLSTTLPPAQRKRLAQLLAQHGGRVAEQPSSAVDFLVQGHNDEQCDERLEACCELGVMAVPPAYLNGCVAAGRAIPFREWAQQPPPKVPAGGTLCRPCAFLDPVRDPSLLRVPMAGCCARPKTRRWLLGALDCGNVDARARETEELNQTLTDYIEQSWPRPGEGGRGIIYVQPMQTVLAGARKPSAEAASPELLRQMMLLLEAYFHCKAVELPPIPLTLTPARGKMKPSGRVAGQTVQMLDSGSLSVLDLLDAMNATLPEDGYCILGLTDRSIFEDEDDNDGSLLGRAFGGSRIAVFSTVGCSVREMAQPPPPRSRLSQSEWAQTRLAKLLSTVMHETMHCFGLDHCGLYTCCMNSWADDLSEFSLAPIEVKKKKKHGFSGNVLGTLHVCPICVRKLQSACGFELRERYVALAKVYAELGFAAQQEWCAEVVKRGDAVV